MKTFHYDGCQLLSCSSTGNVIPKMIDSIPVDRKSRPEGGRRWDSVIISRGLALLLLALWQVVC